MMGAQQDRTVGLSVALLGVWLSVPTCHLQSALGSTFRRGGLAIALPMALSFLTFNWWRYPCALGLSL